MQAIADIFLSFLLVLICSSLLPTQTLAQLEEKRTDEFPLTVTSSIPSPVPPDDKTNAFLKTAKNSSDAMKNLTSLKQDHKKFTDLNNKAFSNVGALVHSNATLSGLNNSNNAIYLKLDNITNKVIGLTSSASDQQSYLFAVDTLGLDSSNDGSLKPVNGKGPALSSEAVPTSAVNKETKPSNQTTVRQAMELNPIDVDDVVAPSITTTVGSLTSE